LWKFTVSGFKPTSLQLELIKTNGIRHYTSEKAVLSIFSEKQLISNRDGIVHFFVNIPTPRKVYAYNILKHYTPESPKTHVIIIENLTNEQIANIKIRPHGNAVIYKGTFAILPENNCTSRPIDLSLDVCG
jgi:hypothetical protein